LGKAGAKVGKNLVMSFCTNKNEFLVDKTLGQNSHGFTFAAFFGLFAPRLLGF
jgi:hypothetical protein